MNRRRFLRDTAFWVGAESVQPWYPRPCSPGENAKAACFSDLSQALPRSAFSVRHAKGKWQVLAYETTKRKGRLLYADPGASPAQLRLPLNLRGWHAIHVALPGIESIPAYVKLRLSGERSFTPFQLSSTAYPNMEEGFWKVADLSGQDLLIAALGEGESSNAAVLGHIRCTPLSAAEVEWWQREHDQQKNRRLIALNDGHALFYAGLARTPQDIGMWIEPLRHTDFGRLIWGALDMDVAQYPAQVATPFGAGLESSPDPNQCRVAEIMTEFKAHGQNPLDMVRESAHDCGLKVSFGVRMNYLKGPPFEEIFGRLFWDNPEYWLRQRDGSPAGISFGSLGVSYACEPVQGRMRAVIGELAKFRPDGVHLLYTRFPPFLGYEDAAVVPFRTKHGVCPKKLADDDPRWLNHKAEIMTGFMKRLRADLDAIGKAQGKRLELSASVESREIDLRSTGIDVAAWMRLGLVDWVIAYPQAVEVDSECWKQVEADKFRQWARGTDCQVFGEVQGVAHEIPGASSALPRDGDQSARHLYQLGADGLSFWDTSVSSLRSMNTLRWLGHRDELLGERAFGRYREVTVDPFVGMTVYRLPNESDI